MANIVLKTFAAGDEGQGTVTPQDDALIYQNAVSVNGIFGGATVTLTGANTLHVASGFGIICGRFFEINESDISVQLSSSGTLNGRLKIHLDLNNADNPIEIVTETGATLPALSGDSNININGGAFDMELCTFSVNELTISSLVNTFPTIDNTSKQVRRKTAYAVNDFVLCQSASDAFVFICTTAGTTAIQEPKAYVSVASGSSVTDGTAVFKAYNLYSWIEGKAPKSHASTGTTYGIGTTTKYGHCMTINGLTQSSHADGKALSAYQGKVLNDKISKTEVLTSNIESSIATVQTTLVASKAYAVGEQFVYNGLLYKATATIAQGGTITINGNCELADSVTGQITELSASKNSYNFTWGYEKANIKWLNGSELYTKVITYSSAGTSEQTIYTESNPSRSIVLCEILWTSINGRNLSPSALSTENLHIEWTSSNIIMRSLPTGWIIYVRIWAY